MPTFPELLNRIGYRTGLVGKYHIRQDPRGFEYGAIHSGQGEYFHPVYVENRQEIRKKGYANDLTTYLALSFLDRPADNRPFCLAFQPKSPHHPFTPAPRHNDLNTHINIPEPTAFVDDYASRDLAAAATDMRLERSLAGDCEDLPADLTSNDRKRWIYQRFMKDRYRTLCDIDENLGRILNRLEDLALRRHPRRIYL